MENGAFDIESIPSPLMILFFWDGGRPEHWHVGFPFPLLPCFFVHVSSIEMNAPMTEWLIENVAPLRSHQKKGVFAEDGNLLDLLRWLANKAPYDPAWREVEKDLSLFNRLGNRKPEEEKPSPGFASYWIVKED